MVVAGLVRKEFEGCFGGLALPFDPERIWGATVRLGTEYSVDRWRLPLPLWALRPYEESGPGAWSQLQHDFATSSTPRKISIYLHVPFCTSKCGFCDSYSFKLGRLQDEHRERYLQVLCEELASWSRLGNLSGREVSTVHLGGGTPATLGPEGLETITACCRELFAITQQTEWALETTVESLTGEMIQALHDLGFRRLHLGVQTLENEVRLAIGRRRPGDEVLERVQIARNLGWITSADLICGLPFQTFSGFLQGISDLVDCGIDGFSLYELLIYPQNRAWAQAYGLDRCRRLPNFWMFAAGALALEVAGFRKNLFNHWANRRDRNIYFTYPTRGEDLLAVGAIADGVFGTYHYRHPRYAEYLRRAQPGHPGLEGGLRRTAFEDQLQPVTTAVLSASFRPELLESIQSIVPDQAQAKERWLAAGLVQPDSQGRLALTSSGSWFAGNMIGEISGHAPKRVLAQPPSRG